MTAATIVRHCGTCASHGFDRDATKTHQIFFLCRTKNRTTWRIVVHEHDPVYIIGRRVRGYYGEDLPAARRALAEIASRGYATVDRSEEIR